jgi:hypothetical protein
MLLRIYLLYFLAFPFFMPYVLLTMKNKIRKSNDKLAEEAVKSAGDSTIRSDALSGEAFLQEAEKEPKRILLVDHINTITTLRDKKRLTFRAIAEWFGERGIETDQGAIYRAYCASFPNVDDYGNPVEDEDKDADRIIGADENVRLKKSKS